MKIYRIVLPVLPLVMLAGGCGSVSRTMSDASESTFFGAGDSPQQKYIAQYSRIAVEERKRSGVPASITLAQGMLESGNGMSELAVRGNNHFGIKCHDWKGQKIYYDDDRKGECFRKYRTVDESYRDHSDFLRYRDRYKFLFDYHVTDYKAWAYGLKKAGYATDPAYPKKLINLIEEYDLGRFDRAGRVRNVRPAKDTGKEETASSQAAVKEKNGETVREDVKVPATPTELETPKPLTDRKGSSMRLSLTRQLYSQNGVPFVYSAEGETYSDIARYYGLFFNEILRYNDLSADKELLPGTVVYLQPKKSRAARQVDKYVAEGGESLRDIAQRYAVKLKSLMKLNNIYDGRELHEGEMILLRK